MDYDRVFVTERALATTEPRYRIQEEIGSGGMAVVNIGTLVGAAGFSRVVAIKRLHAHLAHDARFTAMFVDEARLSSRIRAPNVVQTLDVIEDAAGVALVMDYVVGVSLSQITEEANGPLPLGVATAILCDVLRGLHAAHEAKGKDGRSLSIVHRDVSPKNVLVGKDGIARVIDFGVAKAAQREAITSTGEVKGTFGYMAPEQMIVDRTVTRTADIYGAAVVFWQLLAGVPLFPGNDIASLRSRLAGAKPRSVRELNAEVPPELDALIHRALDDDAKNRPRTALLFDEEIRRISPPEPRAFVESWVYDLLGPAIDLAEERVARTERAAESLAAEASAIVVHSRESQGRVLADDEMKTTVDAPRRHRLSRPLASVVAVGALLTLLLSWKFLATPRPEARSLAADDLAPSTTTAPIEPEPSPSSVTSAVVVAPTASTFDGPPKENGTRPLRRKDRRTSRCNPPYTIDEAGHKVYKPNCL